MASISIQGTNAVASNKLHFYIRPAGTALADYKDATVTTAIGSGVCSYFPKVETGFSLAEETGNTIVTTTGQEIVLDKNINLEFNFLGATPTDYTELKSGTNKYNQANVDIILIKAPASRVKNTVEIGDEVYVIYNAIADVRLSVGDGTPTKITIAANLTESSENTAIYWGKVVADT
jgi:hypothetical protein